MFSIRLINAYNFQVSLQSWNVSDVRKPIQSVSTLMNRSIPPVPPNVSVAT